MLELLSKEARYSRFNACPLGARVALWRRGFLSESAVIYNLASAKFAGNYLSDYHRFARTAFLNDPFDVVLSDKLIFWGLLRNFSPHVAPVAGLTQRGLFTPFERGSGVEPIAVGLARLAGRQILKPLTASGGAGVLLYEQRESQHWLDREPVSDEALARALRKGVHLVCSYVEQATYARTIFPDVANTIRLLTMYDVECGEAFIASAAHRFGAKATGAAVDNWVQGGIAASIDVQTGRLGPGYAFPLDGKLVARREHPDSGASIEGIVIPNWPQIRDGVVDLATRLPFLPYVGWDLIPTERGFSIIEGNNRPAVNIMQLQAPLLDDPRVRAFYERAGVVSRAA